MKPPEWTSLIPLRVGDVLYGYCGGAFGSDSYGDKRVEAIGADWVVVREDAGFAPGVRLFWGKPEALCEYRDEKWRPE